MARELLRRLRSWEGLLLALLLVVLAYNIARVPNFLTVTNQVNLFQLGIEKAIVVLIMTFVIISGEIDLSVASTLGLASAVLGKCWAAGWPLWLCIATALVVGALCGLLNGLLVTKLGLPSLVVTLGTLALYRGLAYVVLGSQAVSDYPGGFASFGFKSIPGTGLPWTVLVFIPLLIVLLVLLHRSWLGRQLYAAGSNAEAARFAAVRVNQLKLGLFVLTGVVSAMAGVIYTARVSSSRADNATGFELDVVAAVLLGGVSIFGGSGTLVGVVLSLAVIGTLRQVLALNSSNAELQSIAIGSLLILSVLGPNLARSAAGLRVGRQFAGLRWRGPSPAD